MKLIMAGSTFPLGDLDEHPLSRCHSVTYDGGYRWEMQLGTARLLFSRNEARYLMKFWDAIKAVETVDESTADMYDHKIETVHALEDIKNVHEEHSHIAVDPITGRTGTFLSGVIRTWPNIVKSQAMRDAQRIMDFIGAPVNWVRRADDVIDTDQGVIARCVGTAGFDHAKFFAQAPGVIEALMAENDRLTELLETHHPYHAAWVDAQPSYGDNPQQGGKNTSHWIDIAEQVGTHREPIKHQHGWPKWLHTLVTTHNNLIGTPAADAVELEGPRS
jgi:hypothetical protein